VRPIECMYVANNIPAFLVVSSLASKEKTASVGILTREELPWYGIGAGEIVLVQFRRLGNQPPTEISLHSALYLEEQSTSTGTKNPTAVVRFHRDRLVFPTLISGSKRNHCKS
jgi:hypothetical protein